jgi:hypothetical protein
MKAPEMKKEKGTLYFFHSQIFPFLEKAKERMHFLMVMSMKVSTSMASVMGKESTHFPN